MTEASPDSAQNLENVQQRQGWWVLGWLAFLGLVIYELTAQPALGVATVCLKFGWEDFRTARWLRRVDPERRRGRACFWLYLASGLWRTAILGTILMFAICWAVTIPRIRQQGAPGQPPTEFIAALMTAMVGFILSTVATWAALFRAKLAGIKLWLSNSVHEARRQNIWPPPNAFPLPTNHARKLVLTALLTISPALFLPLIFCLVPLMNNMSPMAMTFVCLGLVTTLAFTVLVLRETLSRGFAACPSECWRITVASQAVGTDEP